MKKNWIQILIVFIVLAIFASIILIGLKSGVTPINLQRIGHLKSIQNALDLYFEKNKSYPSSLEGLKVADIGITKLPVDPKSKENYFYVSCNNGKDYVLMAKLDSKNTIDKSSKNISNGSICNQQSNCDIQKNQYCISSSEEIKK